MLLQIQCLYCMTVYLLLKHLTVNDNSVVKDSTYIYRVVLIVVRVVLIVVRSFVCTWVLGN